MIIFHGEDQTNSRAAFLAARQKAKASQSQILDLPGDSLTLPALRTAVETESLFGSSNILFLEFLFSRRPSHDKKLLTDYLSTQVTKEIYVWEPKDVSVHIKSFPPNTVRKFDPPKYIFTFLDHLDLVSFHRCLESLPVEQILASLATRLHKVLLGQGRFQGQFTQSQLKKMNSELLQIDYRQKTSSSPMDLGGALEVWLIKTVH